MAPAAIAVAVAVAIAVAVAVAVAVPASVAGSVSAAAAVDEVTPTLEKETVMFESIAREDLATATGGFDWSNITKPSQPGYPMGGGPTIFNPQGPRPEWPRPTGPTFPPLPSPTFPTNPTKPWL